MADENIGSKAEKAMFAVIHELWCMSLEELEAVKPEFLASLQDLSEMARNACTDVIEIVIEHKKAKLQATT